MAPVWKSSIDLAQRGYSSPQSLSSFGHAQNHQRLEQIGAGGSAGYGYAQGLQHLSGLEALGCHGVVEQGLQTFGRNFGGGGQGGGMGRKGGAYFRIPLLADHSWVVFGGGLEEVFGLLPEV